MALTTCLFCCIELGSYVVFLFDVKVCSEEGQEEDFILESSYCISQSESCLSMYFVFFVPHQHAFVPA